MGQRTTIDFVWQGSSNKEVFNHWNDGLREAMRIIEKTYKVSYKEPWHELTGDIILYWEAPCTINGKNGGHYEKVMNTDKPKILLFAGGPLKAEWIEGFDLLVLESKINADECERDGIKYKMAFGINEKIFKPKKLDKKYDGIHHGTCASWKRQDLLGEALGDRAVVCGRLQESDPLPFQRFHDFGGKVFEELSYEDTCNLINESHVMVQTSDFWGGGQRATLEAMACGIPVVCMKDSPKNREFVEESGAGLVVDPQAHHIRDAVDKIKNWTDEEKQRGIDYVKNNWTSQHYADSLLKAIKIIRNG